MIIMSKRKETQEELKNISPFLSEIEKKNSFKVPATYFENLTDDILKEAFPKADRSPVVENKPNWLDGILENIAILFSPRLAVSLATVAALLVAAFFIFPSQNNAELLAMDELSFEEVTDYISANIDDFDEDLILEFASEDVSQNIFSPAGIGDEDLDLYFDDIIDEIDEGDLEDLL